MKFSITNSKIYRKWIFYGRYTLLTIKIYIVFLFVFICQDYTAYRFVFLGAALNTCTLSTLDLTCNRVQTEGFIALIKSVKTTDDLKSLRVSIICNLINFSLLITKQNKVHIIIYSSLINLK